MLWLKSWRDSFWERHCDKATTVCTMSMKFWRAEPMPETDSNGSAPQPAKWATVNKTLKCWECECSHFASFSLCQLARCTTSTIMRYGSAGLCRLREPHRSWGGRVFLSLGAIGCAIQGSWPTLTKLWIQHDLRGAKRVCEAAAAGGRDRRWCFQFGSYPHLQYTHTHVSCMYHSYGLASICSACEGRSHNCMIESSFFWWSSSSTVLHSFVLRNIRHFFPTAESC